MLWGVFYLILIPIERRIFLLKKCYFFYKLAIIPKSVSNDTSHSTIKGIKA